MSGGSDSSVDDSDLLGWMGVSVDEYVAPHRRFCLWESNEKPFWLFVDVALNQKQWIWVNREMSSEMVALDGGYLVSYLSLRFKKKKVAKYLQKIQWIAFGYLNPDYNEDG